MYRGKEGVTRGLPPGPRGPRGEPRAHRRTQKQSLAAAPSVPSPYCLRGAWRTVCVSRPCRILDVLAYILLVSGFHKGMLPAKLRLATCRHQSSVCVAGTSWDGLDFEYKRDSCSSAPFHSPSLVC